jgi:DNA-binding NarL/FixJ family response regulator
VSAPPPQPRLVVLTPQQRAVIGHLAADGADDQQIARRLGISLWTVRSHMKAALQRTGARSRTQLAVWLLRRQIVVRVQKQSGRPPKEPAHGG